jgi:mono/diheme cytochrome c family protein
VKALTLSYWLVLGLVVFPAAAGNVVFPASAGSAENRFDYTRDVKPLLKARCYACHGALKQEARLRLDTADFARKGGEDGRVLIPGDVKGSELIRRVGAKDKDERMPPEGQPLTSDQIRILSRWIAAGARGPADEKPAEDPRRHWAFQLPARQSPPVIAGDWTRNPVDAFLADQQRRNGLTPLAEAEKSLLLRRVYWDLIGLPPTVAQLQDFIDDTRPDAWEHVVDELLSNPHYGERWGRHWMDVWRYSDWYGLGEQVRNAQKHMWHWRDWIVESLNESKGYDRMILEMLAADEIAPLDADALRATGFLVRNYYLFNRTTWLDATVEHTSKAFLGVTLNCAKCHDHKFDPFSQVDYYRFRAIFEPHQVRMEMLPGEMNLEQDGLPRVFDAHLDAPTYLLRRGDEKQPDRSQSLRPGVPAVLASPAFATTPVNLPAEAASPSLRPYVRSLHLVDAELQIQKAVRNLETARAQLKPIEADAAKTPSPDRRGKSLRVARVRVNTAEQSLRAAEAHRSLLQASFDLDRARHKGISRADEQALAAAASALARTDSIAQIEANVAQIELAMVSQKATSSEMPTSLGAARKRLARLRKSSRMGPPLDVASLAALKAPEGPAETEASRRTPFPRTSTGRRTALARWIVDRKNPLTARVAVNQVWMRHMNRPLVDSVADFGLRSPSPPQKELLDWLANDFMDHGWNLKRLHRLIVTSRAYRLSSDGNRADAATRRSDPENAFFWKFHASRIEAELIRDGIFYLAGSLDEHLGGPTIDPALEMAPRRSLYFTQSMDLHERFLSMFDEADVLQCYRRELSVLPQQALALANSRVTLQMAGNLAARLDRETVVSRGSARDVARVQSAFRRILTREPTPDELAACVDFLRRAETLLPAKPGRDRRALESLVVALLNHNDFITIR